jgi:hypothetical protein
VINKTYTKQIREKRKATVVFALESRHFRSTEIEKSVLGESERGERIKETKTEIKVRWVRGFYLGEA